MRIILDRTLFDTNSPSEAINLLELLVTVVRDSPIHALLTVPPYSVSGGNGPIDNWLASRPTLEAKAFRIILEQGTLNAAGSRAEARSDSVRPRRWHLPGSLEIRVISQPESDWRSRRLTLSDAVGLLREPVHLVLENARTELAFMRHLAGPTNGASLRVLELQPGRLIAHGGGGGEAKKWLEALTENPPTPATWRKMLRAWVVFDNDSGDADVRMPSRSSAALIDLCEEIVSIHGDVLSWVCLLRREIESYVPNNGLLTESLDAQKDFVRKVIMWRADPTRVAWAWALDLKKGLSGDLREDVQQGDRKNIKEGKLTPKAHQLKEPFSRLSPEEILTLKRGLGDRLGDALRAEPDRTWTSEIPAEYDCGPAEQAPRLSLVQSLFDRI